ncbi:MAG: vitamin K epoxide reductase family protein [Bacteroidota bacterium]
MDAASPERAPAVWLGAYRPRWDRLVFIIALLGFLVTVQLWTQEQRGFAEGCMGLGAAAETSYFDCAAVVSSTAGTVFGLSNTIWGMLFYVALAVGSFGLALVPASYVKPLKRLRALTIVMAFGYSMYLTLYQFTQLDARCLLCLLSALAVTSALVVTVIDAATTPSASATAERAEADQAPTLEPTPTS